MTRSRDAFTFVEILIALVICALLVGTVCTSLIQVLRTERYTLYMRGTPLLLQTLACRTYLDHESPKEIAALLPYGWIADSEIITTTDEDETKTPWQVWRLNPDPDPGFIYTISLRAGLGAW